MASAAAASGSMRPTLCRRTTNMCLPSNDPIASGACSFTNPPTPVRPLYFDDAVKAAAQAAVTLDKVTADRAPSVDPASYSFVVISDVASLPAAFTSKLLDYIHRGGNVLIALGTVAAQQQSLPIFGGKILTTATLLEGRRALRRCRTNRQRLSCRRIPRGVGRGTVLLRHGSRRARRAGGGEVAGWDATAAREARRRGARDGVRIRLRQPDQ